MHLERNDHYMNLYLSLPSAMVLWQFQIQRSCIYMHPIQIKWTEAFVWQEWHTYSCLMQKPVKRIIHMQRYMRLDMPSIRILDVGQFVAVFMVSTSIKYWEYSHMAKLVYCFNYSGAGAHLFRSWATYLNRSIILTPEVFYVTITSSFQN